MRSLGAESQLLSLCAPGESFWMYRVDAPLGGGGALEPVAIVESAVTEDRTDFPAIDDPVPARVRKDPGIRTGTFDSCKLA